MFDPHVSARALNWKTGSNAYATSDKIRFLHIFQGIEKFAAGGLSACAQNLRGLFYLLQRRQRLFGALKK
jgi:hypothetical protein